MRVLVKELVDRQETVLEGEAEDVRRQLLARFHWLARRGGASLDLDGLLERLGRSQGYSVTAQGERSVAKSEATAGSRSEASTNMADPFAAARWLSGAEPRDPTATRAALWQADNDREAAALDLHGLGRDQVPTLRAWGKMHLAPQAQDDPVSEREVAALLDEGEAAAKRVRAAFSASLVTRADVGGKHSAGTLWAKDPLGGVLMLKPGVGVSPIRGEGEDPVNQARRECAYWHVADAWGLSRWIPRSDLLRIGEDEMAAIEALGRRWSLLGDVEAEAPGTSRRVLRQYLAGGVLHRWAALAFILGDGDANAENVMTDGEIVRLIDHGSAFAGRAFDPPRDRASFVPWWLRCWGPTPWNILPRAEKLQWMPRVGQQDEQVLRTWLLGLDRGAALRAMTRYGVGPEPSLARLDALLGAVATGPADAAINAVWV